jgi:hypothetical protein
MGNKRGQTSLFGQQKVYERTPLNEMPNLVTETTPEIKLTDVHTTNKIIIPDLKIYPTFETTKKDKTLNSNPNQITQNSLINDSPINFKAQYRISVKDITKPKQEIIQETEVITDSKIILSSRRSTKSRSSSDYKIDIKPEEKEISKPIIITPTINITNLPKYSTKRIEPEPIIPKIPTFNISPSSITKKRSYQGFDVFVKSKGRFNRVNSKSLSRGGALSLGSSIVGRTPSVTFKIEKKGRVTKEEKTPNLKRFKRKGGLFIEENKFRINSIGELRGITFKSKRGSVL